MEFLLNGEGYSITDAIPMNNSPPDFRFHCAENSQPSDGFPQSLQKTKNPANNERRSPVETQGFMMSRNGAQSDQRASTVSNFKYPEATPVTIMELGRSSVNLSVNGAGTLKVGKKRSRATRKARTTLFNTDTANFRAMVQRFTGIPETPFRFSSTNPNFYAHVGQQELQVLRKPLTYKGVLDPHMNCVTLNSVPHNYGPLQYNTNTFVPFQFAHHNINISSPLNMSPNAAQGQSSNLTVPNDVGLINSASAFPTPSITLPLDRSSAYLI